MGTGDDEVEETRVHGVKVGCPKSEGSKYSRTRPIGPKSVRLQRVALKADRLRPLT